jgi:uncharacterized membrane protein YpjA
MELPSRENLFRILFFLNIAAVFTGLWYYQDQLSATPLQLLIFVPDCPLYVLLAIPILAKKIKNDAYSFFVSIGMVKYGLWTVFVLLFHWDAYSLPAYLPVTLVFIAGHLGMALEGAALLPAKKVAQGAVLLSLAWFLLNDISDYFWGTVPLIPTGGMDTVRNLTFAASFALTLGLYLYYEKVRSFLPVKFFRWVIQN